MKNRHLSRFLISTFVAIAALAGGFLLTAPVVTESQEQSMARFDRNGDLLRPVGYREWIFVGTPVTPNELNNGKAAFPEFHHVYIHPKAWTAYQKTGKFADGTILIKELVSVGSKKAASGNGYFAGNYIGLEAAVKDAKRFPNEPGNWAYFSFSNEDQSLPVKDKATAFPTATCAACHQGAAAEDLVFTQYYPVLRAAKPKK